MMSTISKVEAVALALGAVALIMTAGCAGDGSSNLTAPELEAVTGLKHHNPGHDGGPGGGGGNGGGGGDDGGGASTVTMTGGMIATDQPVDIQKENKKSLAIQTGGNQIPVELAMVTTRDTYLTNLGACTVDQPEDFTEAKKEELLGYLVDAVQNRHWRMEVDKASLGSETVDNTISTTFNDDRTGALITIVVGSPELMPLRSTVDEGPTDTFTLSGGAVRVADRSGKGTKGTLKIACPNEDLVTVALQR